MATATSPNVSTSLLQLDSRSPAVKIAAVLAGTAVLALSSYISVPMVPVPVTLQTLAILLVGALYGPRLAPLTIIVWLAESAVGMPVLAGGAGGIAPFFGTTAGYILSWPLIAWFVGYMVEKGWNGNRPLLAFVAMFAASAFCLAVGGLWLAKFIGFEKALKFGVMPFIIGDTLKSALAATILAGLVRAKKPNA